MRQPIVLHVRHLPTAGSSSQMPHVQGEPCSGGIRNLVPVTPLKTVPCPTAPSQRQLRLAVGTLHLPQLHLRPSVPAAPCTCSNCTRGLLHLPRQLDLWQPADGSLRWMQPPSAVGRLHLRELPSAGSICGSLPSAGYIYGSLPSAARICGTCTCGTLQCGECICVRRLQTAPCKEQRKSHGTDRNYSRHRCASLLTSVPDLLVHAQAISEFQ